ncbi:MAG TPA: tRNA-dihydrouridine synthase family protein [Nannocystis sp.]
MTPTCQRTAAPPLAPPPRVGEDVLEDIRRRGAARWAAVWAMRGQVAATPDAPGLYLALAPMDGITDAVYRALLTGLYGGRSGISLCVSEFVRVTRDPVPPAVLVRDVPELARGGCTPAGVPVFVQLLGGAPEPMAETARRAAALGAPGIDLNFGCPAKIVNNHDGGACLLREPPRIRTIVARVRDAVPAAIPVTVKIRVGWDSSDTLEEIAAAAAAGGASWLTIHARTRTQLYAPPVRWPELARARAAVAIPVVANGDLRVPEDLSVCAAQSGCQAFMIGRAAMARPDLFAAIRGWRADAPLPLAELAAIVRAYHAAMLSDGLEPARAVARVKQWLRLAADIDPRVVPHFAAIKAASQFSAIAAHLDTMG